MKPQRRPVPRLAAMGRPEIFMAREHVLTIVHQPEDHWTVSVDDRLIPGTFETQVEAWEAGVRAADLQDRLRTA
jgi:hypothetical protein